MSERQAEQWEKDWIRDEIERAVASRATADQICDIRKEMADLLGLSIYQVAAISAWKREEGEDGLVLKELSLTDTLIPDIPLVSQTNEVDSSILLVSDPETTEKPAESNEAYRKAYEHVTYDNELKERWRQKWVKFIDENIPKELRAEMKVLCLPAQRCLEIQHYLKLGFRRKNITGVMKGEDAEAVNEFQRNASDLGIQTHIGNLEEFLANNTTRFGVAVLDFHCGFTPRESRTLKSLLLEKESILITNFAAKRELSEIQGLFDMSHYYHRIKAKKNFNMNTSFKDQFEEDLEEEQLRAELFKFPVARSREAGLTGYFERVGTLRAENRLFNEQERAQFINAFQHLCPEVNVFKIIENNKVYDRTDPKVWLELQAVKAIAAEASVALEKLLGITPCDNPRLCAELCSLLIEAAAIGRSLAINSEQWHYQSEAGTSHTTYISNFLKLRTPLGMYKEMRPTIDFLLHLGGYFLDTKLTKSSEGWTSRKGGEMCMMGETPDRLFFKLGNGDTRDVGYLKLMNDLNQFHILIQKTAVHQKVLEKGSTLIE